MSALHPSSGLLQSPGLGLEEDFPDNWITLYISSLQFPLTFQRAKMGLIVLLSSLSALQVLIFPGFCS